MPGLMTMKPVGAASKARSSSSRGMARSKDGAWDEVAAPPSTLVRVPSVNTTGFWTSQLHTRGSVAVPKATECVAEKATTQKLFINRVHADRMGIDYSSSGSEHGPSSACFAAMVDDFLEYGSENEGCGRSRYEDDDEDANSSLGGELSEVLQGLVPCTNATERILFSEVSKALVSATSSGEGLSTCLRRQVMKHLRSAGYNSAICKSRWDHAGGFPGGDYEYVDVVFEGATGKSERILIDVEFKVQFEIARPTARFNAILQVLPTIFVGKSDRLQQIVNIMSEAAKLSLKNRGMHLPPWRKPEYLRAKWFSSYRRTTSSLLHRKDEEQVIDIARTAVRGRGWDARFTDEMEVDYEIAESRQVMKELKNVVRNRPLKMSSKRVEDAVPVRNIIENMDWQLPSPSPRVFQRPGPAGLASILREAGLTSSIRKLSKEGESERRTLGMAV